MDLKTTGPETGDRSGSQANDLKEEEGAYEKPLASGTNNNQLLPPDGFDQDVPVGAGEDTETNYVDNDVFFESSLPPKNSRTGKKSQCPDCDKIVSTTNMSRHIKQYHCPGGINYKSAKSTRRSSKPKSVKIKIE